MKKKEAELPVKVRLAISSLEKVYGKNCVMWMGREYETDTEEVYSTNSKELDLAIGGVCKKDGVLLRGIPTGCIVEIFGGEKSGKTALCNHLMASGQKAGRLCAVIDTEQRWDMHYAEVLGVNVKDLIISQPDCAEEALKIVETLMSTGQFSVIVYKSVFSLAPRYKETSIEELLSKALRRLSPVAKANNTLVVFTNELRNDKEDVNNPLKSYASLRISLKTLAQQEDDKEKEIRFEIVRNKLAVPYYSQIISERNYTKDL